MAAIDKIYIDSFEKYKRFKDWCLTNTYKFKII